MLKLNPFARGMTRPSTRGKSPNSDVPLDVQDYGDSALNSSRRLSALSPQFGMNRRKFLCHLRTPVRRPHPASPASDTRLSPRLRDPHRSSEKRPAPQPMKFPLFQSKICSQGDYSPSRRYSLHGIIVDIIPSMEYLLDGLERRTHLRICKSSGTTSARPSRKPSPRRYLFLNSADQSAVSLFIRDRTLKARSHARATGAARRKTDPDFPCLRSATLRDLADRRRQDGQGPVLRRNGARRRQNSMTCISKSSGKKG